MMRMWAEIFNFLKNISLGLIELLCPWINCPTHLPSPAAAPPPPPPQLPPQSTAVELSGGVAAAVPTAEQAPPPSASNIINHNGKMREWPLLVIGVCFAAASLGLQAIQTFDTFPLSFHCFCMALEFSYAALIVSIYIRPRYPLASLVMEHVSVFFGSTAFTIIIAMNLPTLFMLILVAVYLISILVIIFVNLFGPTP